MQLLFPSELIDRIQEEEDLAEVTSGRLIGINRIFSQAEQIKV